MFRLSHLTEFYPEKNLRAYPGTVRGTEEWNKTYKLIIFSIIHSCLIGFLGKTY